MRKISSNADGYLTSIKLTPKALDAQEETTLADLDALSISIIAFTDSPKSISGFTIARPSDCQRITTLLYEALICAKRPFANGNQEVTKAFFACVSLLEQSPVCSYPSEMLRLTIVKAKALIESSAPSKALEGIHDIATRPYVVEGNLELLSDVLMLEVQAQLMLGYSDEAAATAWRALSLFGHVAPTQARLAFRRFAHALQLVPARKLPPGRLPRLLHRLAGAHAELTRESGSRWSRLARRGKLKAANRMADVTAVLTAFAPPRSRRQQADPTAAQSKQHEAVLVTRAMGGVGDLIMMTPGLHALAKKSGQPVHFATKKAFFPLFTDNPDVVLHDIDGPALDPQDFRRWHDLSFCPAGRYESRRRPNVDKGRVELFATGMGVSSKLLSTTGVKPRLGVTAESKHAADTFFTEHGLDGQQPIIGVQPFSRERYREYPHMVQLIGKLAENNKVIVFHHVAFPLAAHRNIIPAFGQPLGDALALLRQCHILVCVDSAFLHAAAAFDIPTVAVFGPIDGEIRTKHHAKAHVIALRETFKCMPCWRNEDIPCQLTGGTESACLAAIDPDRIVSLVVDLLKGPVSIGNPASISRLMVSSKAAE